MQGKMRRAWVWKNKGACDCEMHMHVHLIPSRRDRGDGTRSGQPSTHLLTFLPAFFSASTHEAKKRTISPSSFAHLPIRSTGFGSRSMTLTVTSLPRSCASATIGTRKINEQSLNAADSRNAVILSLSVHFCSSGLAAGVAVYVRTKAANSSRVGCEGVAVRRLGMVARRPSMSRGSREDWRDARRGKIGVEVREGRKRVEKRA